jgi:hypothetical protein
MADKTLFDNIFAGPSGLAETLLKTLGLNQGATVKLLQTGTYAPKTGSDPKDPLETVVVNASPPIEYALNQIDGTNILKGDVQNIIGASDLITAGVPKERLIQSKLNINGEDLTIISAEPIVSGTLVSAYTLQMRKL